MKGKPGRDEVARILAAGDDLSAAAAARASGRPELLALVAEGSAFRFRALSLQLRLEVADAWASRGAPTAYARAVHALAALHEAMEGEDLRWASLMSAFLQRHGRRRRLLAALRQAGLDPMEMPPRI